MFVIGNSTGNGGTSAITNSFTNWLCDREEFSGIELCSEGEVKLKRPPQKKLSSARPECFVIDSKVTLICIFLFQYAETQFNLFTWNHFDFSFRFSLVLRNRKNINCVDYFARKEHKFFNWDEELLFKNVNEYVGNPTQNLPGERISVCFVGRLTYQKGLDRILKLARDNPSVSFNVIGDGPLLGYVRKKKPDNINMHGFKEGPFENISSNDLLVVPSRYFEGVPLVLLEALSRNIRVISSGVGDLRLIESNSHFMPEINEDFLVFSNSLIKRIVFANNCES